MIIGEWAIKMTVNATDMVTKLHGASQSIGNFASVARSAAATIGTGLNNAINSIARVNLGQQTQQLMGLASGIAGVVAAVGTGGTVAVVGALAGVGSAMVGMASSGMDAIAIQARLGRSLGITATQAGGFSVLMQRAGVSMDDWVQAFDKYPNRLGMLAQEVARGGGSMMDALRAIRIDPEQFLASSVPEQIARMAEGTRHLDAIGREMALDPILGNRIGNRLEGFFRLDPAMFRNLDGISQEFGRNMSQATAAGVMETMRELRELSIYVGSMFSMIGMTMGAVLAPVALHVGRTIRDLVQSAKPIIEMIGLSLAGAMGIGLSLVLGISAATRYAMPFLLGMGDAFTKIKTTLVHVAEQVWVAFSPIGEALFDVLKAFGYTGPMETWGDIAFKVGEIVTMSIKGIAVAAIDMASVLTTSFAVIAQGAVMFSAILPISGEQVTALEDFDARMVGVANQLDIARESILRMSSVDDKGDLTGQNGGSGVAVSLQRTTADIEAVQRIMRELDTQAANIGRDSVVSQAVAARATIEELQEIMKRQEQIRANQANSEIGQRIDRLHEEASTIGMAADAAERLRFAQRGASEAMQEQLYAAQQAHHLATVRHEMEQRVRQTVERNRSPLEQFNDGWTNLLEMQNDAGDRFSPAQQAREAGRLFEQLERSFSNTIREAPGALVQGSREAAQAIASARRDAQGQNGNVQDRMRELMEQADRRAQREEERNRELLDLARNGFIGRLGGA